MRFQWLIGTKECAGEAQIIGDQIWFHFEGRTFSVPLTKERVSKGRGAGAAQSDRIKSPMPGKITKVLKKQGEAVTAGDTVLIMEAMKMEYSLKSEVTGLVSDVGCHIGDQVALGQILMKFEVKTENIS